MGATPWVDDRTTFCLRYLEVMVMVGLVQRGGWPEEEYMLERHLPKLAFPL